MKHNHVPDTSRAKVAILADLKPVKPLPPAWIFLTGFAVIFTLLCGFSVYRLPPWGWQALSTAQKLSLFGTLAVSASLLGHSLVREMAPGSKKWLPPAWGPVLAFGLLIPVVIMSLPFESDEDFISNGLVCLRLGSGWVVLAGALFWLLLRRGAWLSPLAEGTAAGTLAGLVGVTVLQLHCPILDRAHVVTWHLGAAALGAAAGFLLALMGRNFSRTRAKESMEACQPT